MKTPWSLAARAGDGSAASVAYTSGTAAGDWRPTPPAFAPALLPQWPFVKPFAMAGGSHFRPPPPPPISSASYAFDLNLTQQIGGGTSTARTAEQTEIALFWADGAGTATPPGHWNEIAGGLAAARGLTFAQNARMFALLNIALADAAICAWDCKYADDFWRPVTAVQQAGADGNAATAPDPAWLPLIPTPPFPEYTSGHSTFSGAAAAVLTACFGTHETPFTSQSDGLPGVARSFSGVWEAATEAGMSRIYGGIHFITANHQGLAAGMQIGRDTSDRFLLPRKP